MDFGKYVNLPQVALLLRKFAAKENLFQQGQMAASAFFIIEGSVELVWEGDEAEYREGLVGPGQFLGEKALLNATPYQRRFGAVAREATRALEIGAADIEKLQRAAPGLVVELFRAVLRGTTERLDRMNFLVGALRSRDLKERFIGVIHYYCRAIGRREANGVEVELVAENIARYVAADAAVVADWLLELIAAGIVTKRSANTYFIANQAALEDYVRRLKTAA